jgi:hypothetical protein
MAGRINLAQMSPKFAQLQEDLAKARSPEEKIEIMLALCPEEKREAERKKLLEKLRVYREAQNKREI